MVLQLDIEKGSNGGYVVTYYKSMPTGVQKFVGVKGDVEKLAFLSEKELAEWIKNHA